MQCTEAVAGAGLGKRGPLRNSLDHRQLPQPLVILNAQHIQVPSSDTSNIHLLPADTLKFHVQVHVLPPQRQLYKLRDIAPCRYTTDPSYKEFEQMRISLEPLTYAYGVDVFFYGE